MAGLPRRLLDVQEERGTLCHGCGLGFRGRERSAGSQVQISQKKLENQRAVEKMRRRGSC